MSTSDIDTWIASEPKTFEEGLELLNKVTRALEASDLPLEVSLKAYEKGVRLTNFCQNQLSDVEKKIQLLAQDAPQAVSFEKET